MGLKINTIISLASKEKYVLLNETMYGGVKYFLAMGVDERKEIIPNNVKILEEIINGTDLFVKAVTDPDMIVILTRILKSQM